MKKKKELEKNKAAQEVEIDEPEVGDLSDNNVKIKQIAAYALLVLGGKEKPTSAEIKKLLKTAGVKAELDEIDKMIASFGDKPFNELVASGLENMASMGSGLAAGGEAAVVNAAPVEEEKKEEEVDVGPGDLFGEDDY